MSRFPEHLLDDIRARLPVSEVARRLIKTPIKKQGGELVALSPFNAEKTPSFTINDRKRMWHDFSSGKTGDVFKLETELTGCSFPEAVERLAEQAGVKLPDEKIKPNGKANGHHRENRQGVHAGNGFDDGPDQSAPIGDEDSRPLSKDEARRAALRGEPTKVYDYKNADGETLYQKLRFEWTHAGKRQKTFVQRRELPNGEWAWSLGEGDYFRTRDGRWLTSRKSKETGDGDASDEETVALPGVERVPYNLPALLNAVELGEPVFAVEGEKDAETLIAEGLCATCSVGGRWDELAGYFSRADVVQLIDNDPAGEKYAQTLGLALRKVVKSHRVLKFPELPPGGDVTDFYEGGGTTERLFERIQNEAKAWSPTIPETDFAAVHFHQIGSKKPERNWQIKNLLLSSVFALVYGPPACGKSFLAQDLSLTLAWAAIDPQAGEEWFGHKVRRAAGVVYIISEAPEDFEVRLHAWRTRNNVDPALELPFAFLPTTVDMQSNKSETGKLIEEVRRLDSYFEAKFGVRVGMVVIDTVSRALAGGNENAPDVMGAFIRNCEALRTSRPGMTVLAVHHSPIDGSRPRGHSSLHGAADLEIEVRKATDQAPNCWIVRKFKAGAEGGEHHFRLEVVDVAKDADGEPITSCVISGRTASDAAREARKRPRGQVQTNMNETDFLRAVSTALERQGVAPPLDLTVPRNIELVVDSKYVREFYMEKLHVTESGDDSAIESRLRQRWGRVTKSMLHFNVVGHGKVGEASYLWFTGRPISGNVTIRGVRVTEAEKPVTKSADPSHGLPEERSQEPEFPI